MNADLQDFKHTELTEKIIKAFYKVYHIFGYGFLEFDNIRKQVGHR